MRRPALPPPASLLGLALLLAACADYNSLGHTADGGPDGADTGPSGFEGTWLRQTLGDCINFEEWLRIGRDGQGDLTLADLNFCYEHSVTACPGAVRLESGPAFVWSCQVSPDSRSEERFSAAVVDLGELPAWSATYAWGARGLNREAYLATVGTRTWRRTQRESTTGPEDGLVYARELEIELRLAGEPALGPNRLEVRLRTSLDFGTDALREGEETLAWECVVAERPNGWWSLSPAEGGEDGAGLFWYHLFEERDLWARFPDGVADVMWSGFDPVVLLDPSRPGILFHDRGQAWYREVLAEPPSR